MNSWHESENDMETLLIPTGYDPGSYSCVRSLSRRDINTIVASEHDDVLAASSQYCDEVISVPDPCNDVVAYKNALVNIASRPTVRTSVPLRPYDTYVFSKYRDEFDKYITLITPPFEMLDTVFDRIQLVEEAKSANVPVPKTQLVDTVEKWDTERIIKSRYNLLAEEYCSSYSPRDVTTIKDVKHLAPGQQPRVDAICKEMDHVPIAQEYIPSSDEYVFGALYDHGEALATFQHRQIRGNSYCGGGGVYRRSVNIPELDSVARTLLDHLDWHGFACIEYMKDENTGEFTLTEINPRLWQSLPCAVRAGADFPYYYWLWTKGRPDLIDPSYEVGVASHLLYGEIGHLLSIVHDESPLVTRPSFLRTAGEIALSFLTDRNFDTLYLDDPPVFLAHLKSALNNRL